MKKKKMDEIFMIFEMDDDYMEEENDNHEMCCHLLQTYPR